MIVGRLMARALGVPIGSEHVRVFKRPRLERIPSLRGWAL
jgi:hypothetical protein